MHHPASAGKKMNRRRDSFGDRHAQGLPSRGIARARQCGDRVHAAGDLCISATMPVRGRSRLRCL